ncbi:hypothetical protein GGP85_002904 [Salinibacter ruber]|uniref:DUF4376 domain-containing protein n=1 Tax=Salinibacter ruber TaxID=146919 RepID=UPI002166CC61|nr:DUF4376 domain-containing protein [Salinibacter ruber]MCS3827434.1 hypothetical protein [Salinibacter ruber]
MVFLRTNSYGRVQLRHNRPGDLSDSQKSDGVVVDSIPDRPDAGSALYVLNGSPVWKPAAYKYKAQGDLEGYRAHLLEAVKQKRHEAETQGVSYNGHVFGTDSESRQAVAQTLEYARDQQSFSTTWKTSDGFMTGVTASDLEAVRDKIASLRQAAFDREATLATEINAAATIQELTAVDITSGWP